MQAKTHLTLHEREKIEYYLDFRMSLRAIARRLKRDHSVVLREIQRNTGISQQYHAHRAEAQTEKRRSEKRKGKLENDEALHDHVVQELRAGRSPDVIAGRLRIMKNIIRVSHETIYRYIYEGAGRFEDLYRCLKYKQRRRRKRFGRKAQKRSKIPERTSIHARPKDIQARTVFGHWESDTMVFRKQKQVLSVQIERKTRLLRVRRVENKSAMETEAALRNTLESLPPESFKTMTFDNGGEGANHLFLRTEFGMDTYFCDCYASWQKGSVENVNGILRKYFPRTKDLSLLTEREIYMEQERINDTPRKILDYRTPNELVREYLQPGGALLT